MKTQISIDEFFQTKYPIRVFEDSSESGDYRLFCPEDKELAQRYLMEGYGIASIYEDINKETNNMYEYVVCDNDASWSLHKVGFFVYEQII